MRSCLCIHTVLVLILLGVLTTPMHAADSTNMKTIAPEELVRTLTASKGTKPLLFHVGSHMLYVQAHIPGSEYLGAGATPQGVQNLAKRVATLRKNTAIILYCGCCPWNHCPNVNPAYDTLVRLGFTNVKVLYLAQNFGVDWVTRGYPTARGE
ncbi:MAG TPA: rhodanese-like domain-containing protein [Terriglobales bacterium]|nr:rhodanese-like domain-containing protein [Terriglobales bacterium]